MIGEACLKHPKSIRIRVVRRLAQSGTLKLARTSSDFLSGSPPFVNGTPALQAD
jgi:hypothetical protein